MFFILFNRAEIQDILFKKNDIFILFDRNYLNLMTNLLLLFVGCNKIIHEQQHIL